MPCSNGGRAAPTRGRPPLYCFFFQAEDGIRDADVTEFRRVLFRSIVVVENVERVMAEEGLSPVEATRKSMSQIQGALIGIGLVLSAVFVPMAFFGGSTGV